MSLILANSPRHPTAWCGFTENIQIGDEVVSLSDFCQLVRYVMTNFDFVENDPRLELKEDIDNLQIVDGFNPGGKRFS